MNTQLGKLTKFNLKKRKLDKDFFVDDLEVVVHFLCSKDIQCDRFTNKIHYIHNKTIADIRYIKSLNGFYGKLDSLKFKIDDDMDNDDLFLFNDRLTFDRLSRYTNILNEFNIACDFSKLIKSRLTKQHRVFVTVGNDSNKKTLEVWLLDPYHLLATGKKNNKYENYLTHSILIENL